ncbi:amidophosphoribosyltransferase [Cutibacterium acnes JCM 18918]|nr:amidophosphoribosyltransferase [Cutibacterium acnes JCM 18918]
MAVSDGRHMMVFKDMGLVSQVFDEATLNSLQGHMAVGHTRYSTTGASIWDNAQPTFRSRQGGDGLALAHNGNLTNTGALEALIAERAPDTEVPHKDRMDSSNDTSLVTALMTTYDGTLEEVAAQVLPHLQGAFSLVFMDDHTLCAARDPQGIRPLVLGRYLVVGWSPPKLRLSTSSVVLSFARSSPARWSPLTRLGCAPAVSLRPGPRGASSNTFTWLALTPLLLDDVSTTFASKSARSWPRNTLPTPTRHPGARVWHPGCYRLCRRVRHPLRHGPGQELLRGPDFHPALSNPAQLGIRLKLNPLRDVIEGRRIVVVDDSIVRGNTQRQLVRMLREAGAARCTCASLLRRCSGRASTALTSLLALSSSPRVLTSRTSADLSALTRLATSALTASSVPPTLTPITSAGLVLTAFIPYRCLSRREPC